MGIIASKESRLKKAKNEFILAAYENNVIKAEKIIQNYPVEKDEIMNVRETLEIAVALDHREFITFLARYGADLDISLYAHKNALQSAICKEDSATAKLLITLGANVRLATLSSAIWRNDPEIAILFILNGYPATDTDLVLALRNHHNDLAILIRLACNNRCYGNQAVHEWNKETRESRIRQLMRLPVSQFVKQPEVVEIAERYPEIMLLAGSVYGNLSGPYNDQITKQYNYGSTGKLLKKMLNQITERKDRKSINRFCIPKLRNSDKTFYKFMPLGNDPAIHVPNEYRNSDKKIALIATGGFKCVDIACQLGNQEIIPKIFIIDNSKEVYKSWYEFREILSDDSMTGTQQLFESNTMDPDVKGWWQGLFEKFGYDYVRRIARHSSLVLQKWENPVVFEKIDNLLRFHKIEKVFLYPSNIIDFMGDHYASTPHLTDEQYAIFKNIARMKPELTILTDLCWKNHPLWGGVGAPQNVYFIGRGESLPPFTGINYWLSRNGSLWKNPLHLVHPETSVQRKRSLSI